MFLVEPYSWCGFSSVKQCPESPQAPSSVAVLLQFSSCAYWLVGTYWDLSVWKTATFPSEGPLLLPLCYCADCQQWELGLFTMSGFYEANQGIQMKEERGTYGSVYVYTTTEYDLRNLFLLRIFRSANLKSPFFLPWQFKETGVEGPLSCSFAPHAHPA